MSFANQFNAQMMLLNSHENKKPLEIGVYVLPQELDQEIAGVKLETMDVKIDRLTSEQARYIEDYSEGT